MEHPSDSPEPPKTGHRLRAAERFEPLATKVDRSLRHSKFYAGTVGSEEELRVYIVRPPDVADSDSLVAEIYSMAGSKVKIRVQPVSWSIKDLETARDRLVKAVDDCAEIVLSRWGLDIASNRVVVGYVGDRCVLTALLQSLGYDQDIVRAEKDPGLSAVF